MTLIKGVVTPDREAVIDISVTGPTGIQATVTICVDTGFTDHLTLPIDLVRNLNLSYQQTYSGTLADGSLVPLDVYIADVENNRTIPVPRHLRDSHYPGAKELGHPLDGYGRRKTHSDDFAQR